MCVEQVVSFQSVAKVPPFKLLHLFINGPTYSFIKHIFTDGVLWALWK